MKLNGAQCFVSIVIIESCLLVEGARILAVLPFFARSHHRFCQPLMKALARAGHEVVVYSPFPLDKPVENYTEIIMDNVYPENPVVLDLLKKYTEAPYYVCMDLWIDLLDRMFDDFIQSDKIQKLLTSNEHFDLVITEPFTSQEFSGILGHLFKAPVIGIQAFPTNSILNSISGNTLSINHIPEICAPFSSKMGFIERVYNTFYVWRNLYYVYYYSYIPLVKDKIKKHFPDAPPLWDMINNISLVFVNDHLTADYSRPRTPNIIPVAGIHIEDETPLPKTIQKFMDEATDGVIFFSLGTYVPDELHPQEYFDMYINVFRQLKQRVLWKTRNENIQGLPDNVMTVKWAPQRDVLAHLNCVLFITHGGIMSQHETIHCGVPVVVIPQFWDQHRNAMFYVGQGIGVRLNQQDLTVETVIEAIREVLDNPKYSTNIKRHSRLFRDRPMTPAETVVYWTEYVLRHGGSQHLRPASTQLSWYQLALLDVLAAIILIIVSVTVITCLICRRILNYISKNRTNHLRTKKKL